MAVLGDLGYLNSAALLNMLSKQYGLPHVNLFEVKVPPEVLNTLPFEKVRSFHALPISKSDNALSLAMVDPGDRDVIKSIEAATGGRVMPFVVPSDQLDRAIVAFERDGYGDHVFYGASIRHEHAPAVAGMPGIIALLKMMSDSNATELHLTAGARPAMRESGRLRRLALPEMTSGQMRDCIYEILHRDQLEELERTKELNCIFPVADAGRFRITIYRQRNADALSASRIYEDIPSFTDLGLPDWLSGFADMPRGLIVISGPSGQGKSATIASLVDYINMSRSCNIITLEDPVQYLHTHKSSNVNQREVGIDTDSYIEGMRHILRQGPDVIAVGDLSDHETILMALNAAEKGCLVIGEMTARNTISAIDRMVRVFPEDRIPRIKMQIAENLLLVFSQQLVPLQNGKGSALAFEKLTSSRRVANILRDGTIDNIRNLMKISSEDITSIDQEIARLYLSGTVSYDDALQAADSKTYFQELARRGSV